MRYDFTLIRTWYRNMSLLRSEDNLREAPNYKYVTPPE